MSWDFFFPRQFSISTQANPAAAGRGSAADLGRGRSTLGVAWILSAWSQKFQMQLSSLLMGTQKLLSDSKEKEKQGYGHHEAQMRRAKVWHRCIDCCPERKGKKQSNIAFSSLVNG